MNQSRRETQTADVGKGGVKKGRWESLRVVESRWDPFGELWKGGGMWHEFTFEADALTQLIAVLARFLPRRVQHHIVAQEVP